MALESPRENHVTARNQDQSEDLPEEQRPRVIYLDSGRGRRDSLDVVFRVLAGFAMAMIIALLASLLLVIVGLSGAMNAANSSLSQASRAIQDASSAIQGPVQGVLGQLQPDRPPPTIVSQGPEFAELKRVAVGAPVGQTGSYVVTVSRITKRDGATDPNQAQYAVLHRKLLAPRPRMVGPVQVGEDHDEADFYLYKGESFRLGSEIYQVNWVSLDENAVGLVRFRNADAVTGALKFQVD